MSTTQAKEATPVFVPKPQYVELYATLDQALKDAKNQNLMPYENEAAEHLIGILQNQILLAGDTGEFVYPS